MTDKRFSHSAVGASGFIYALSQEQTAHEGFTFYDLYTIGDGSYEADRLATIRSEDIPAFIELLQKVIAE